MKLRLVASLASFLILISGVLAAQVDTESVENDNDQAQSGPVQNDSSQKDNGVARISFIHGDVSTQRGDSGDWGSAALNQPVVAGDRVSTNGASRAEIQLDYANIMRIDERTQANVTALTRTQIQIQLARGLANYSVLKDSEADVEIDAPNLSVHPGRGDGSYRITVISDDQAEVMVRKGEADISTPQGSTRVRSGQTIIVRGTGNDTQYQIADAPSRDDFDRWNSDRDNTIRNAQSWGRTNRYYVGSEDLDAHGRWQSVPDYGDVWVPAVANDWAPYRDGRWVWEPYWGWTWVSSESWGWAPYHYGRWFMYENSWVWWPGQSYGYRSYYRPIWAPAYVSFFGFGGGGFGVGFGFGSVGWLPIGPCDGFYPWWGGYRSRFNTVNIYNVHNVYNYNNRNGAFPPLRGGNRYSNLRLAGENDRMRRAVSSVNANDFGRGRISPTPVSREAFRGGRVVAGNLPVVPTRESLLAGDRRATPANVGRGGTPQRFFSNKQTSPARPQRFDQEAAQVRNAIQRDGHFTPIVGNQRSNAGENNPRGIPQGRVATENSNMVKPNAGIRENGSNQGSNPQSWRRMGTPAQQSGTPGSGSGVSNPARPERGGGNVDWRRAPNSGIAQQGSVGSGSPNNGNASGRGGSPLDRRTTSPAPQGNANQNQDWRRTDRPSAPVNRGSSGSVNRGSTMSAPQGSGNQNQDWRRSDRPSGPVNRSMSGPPAAPASRDRMQGGNSAPTQNSGNDWRRMPSQNSPSNAPSRPDRSGSMDRYPSNNSAQQSQRDSGNWRQSAPRDSGRENSRPQLDMRQPIVTPRSSGPSYSGGYRGNEGGGYSSPRSAPSGGGYSSPRSAPSGGGYSSPRSAPSGGGGHSAPSGGGGHSAPSGGGHSSGGNNGPHRGR